MSPVLPWVSAHFGEKFAAHAFESFPAGVPQTGHRLVLGLSPSLIKPSRSNQAQPETPEHLDCLTYCLFQKTSQPGSPQEIR